MARFLPPVLGWVRDLADPRDLTLAAPEVRGLLEALPKRRPARGERHTAVDLTEFAGPTDPEPVAPAAAAMVVALVEYFLRRTRGEALHGSTAFLAYTSRRLAGAGPGEPVSLRDTLKALVRFGLPAARFGPAAGAAADTPPEAFLYGFSREFAALRYVRLDPRGGSGADALDAVRTAVRAGFACVGGTVVAGSVTTAGELSYPTRLDRMAGGTPLVVLGYDDQRRIRSTKGALRVRTAWGERWGESGHGWLPYRFVEERLAGDFWTLVEPGWLASGELERPW